MELLDALLAEDFRRVAEARHAAGNQVRLLRDGPETFGAWLEAIGAAKRYVWLENYIIQDDAMGAAFAQALIAAAGRGVAVRVLYDWLGCLRRTRPDFWQRLRAGGVRVRVYNPPHPLHPLRWISRDHRKVLCVDGESAFTGGLCIGDDWYGDAARAMPPWRDTAVAIEGPAVAYVEAAFVDSWEAAAGLPQRDVEAAPVADSRPGGVEVSVIAGRPDSLGLYRLEQLIAEIAERRLWLTDGYFVATTAYVRALAGAARGGVDVRLLVPGSSDWPLVGALSKSAYRPLLQAGVRVFEWNGPMLHAKTAVADGCWSRIGSSNSNLASWITNRELDVTIKDHALAAQMEAMYEADMTNATEVVLARGRSGIPRPVAPDGHAQERTPAKAGRLLSGAIGLGSTLSASFTRRRQLDPTESLVVLGGGLVLLLLGAMAVFLPRLVAWAVAVFALWPGVGLVVRGVRLWWASRNDAAR
ncbi:phosphatidylserine/phosphatidylglycerophosphate/cardiolipin synthase family protein [Acidocella sp.]|uniref:phospholipase D-like domain-containing protein n=1 Tax=Acidocella sp. TaxID=50710 RepID=UPI00182D66FB|nr:phospholipase D-like domain-containing protein [Acidocella sp.]NNM57154.1 cardiolipin synthase B [Acidocella sp.]